MSTISSGTTLTTAIQLIGDTTGNLTVTTGSANTVAMTIDNSQNVAFANAVTYNGTVVFDGGLTGNGAGLTSLNGSNVTFGTVSVVNGGTGANSSSAARANLGLVIGTDVLAPNGSAASLTSFPTLNQNTTGSSGSVSNGSWTITISGTKIYFAYSGVNKASLDSSGNLICVGNITAYGTVT